MYIHQSLQNWYISSLVSLLSSSRSIMLINLDANSSGLCFFSFPFRPITSLKKRVNSLWSSVPSPFLSYLSKFQKRAILIDFSDIAFFLSWSGTIILFNVFLLLIFYCLFSLLSLLQHKPIFLSFELKIFLNIIETVLCNFAVRIQTVIKIFDRPFFYPACFGKKTL